MRTLSCLAEETPKNLRSKDLSDAKLRASVFGQRRIRQASDGHGQVKTHLLETGAVQVPQAGNPEG